ncbi:MAG: glycosyltransferase family 1 protein [Candidatus Sumerlaeia bacterium]|nr:glycosyltransferase family 1 protein [Candidatus Sumerlaeia bacterium]
MRVFIDARMTGRSGVGVVLSEVLRQWFAAPPDFDLLLMGAGQELRSEVAALSDGAAQRIRLVPWNAAIYSPAAWFKSARALGARRGDAFLGFHYATSYFPGVPLVCYVHDLLHATHPPRSGTATYAGLALRILRSRAAYTIVPSRHVKVQLQTLWRFPAERVLHIPSGAGLAEGTAPSPGAGPRDYLLAVGLMKPHKNWDFLLKRLAGLWREDRLALPLVVAGLGAETSSFREWLRDVGLDRRVRVEARMEPPELMRLYAGARALLFPSRAEGFGLPVLEALWQGTPVVLADRSPMNELSGSGCLYFDPDSAETFDRAVLAVAEDEAGAARLGQEGLSAVRARYRWRDTADRLAAVLREAAEGGSPQRRRTAVAPR